MISYAQWDLYAKDTICLSLRMLNGGIHTTRTDRLQAKAAGTIPTRSQVPAYSLCGLRVVI